jgi:glycosyltransferase involved in cell wall biosynthesis
MKHEPYILWLGGVFSEETMLSKRAVSPAGNRWQLELIQALKNNGLNIIVLGQLYEQRWPLGSLRPGKNLDSPDNLQVEYARYWNMPFYRQKFLYRSFKLKFNEIIKNRGAPPSLVIPYNPYFHHASLSRHIKNEFNVDWVPVVADFENAGEDWADYKHATCGAKGQVFLSHWAFENCPFNPKLHLDGGISARKYNVTETLNSKNNHIPYVFLYTGAVNYGKGIDLLIDAFSLLSDNNIKYELWICGKMAVRKEGDRILKRINNDSRIKYFGVVKESFLQELSMKADAFVNPRLPGLTEHIMNFPSKLLEYLSYCKPIVSTLTPGLAPQYSDFLICPNNDSIAEFAAAMKKCSDLSDEDRLCLNKKIFNYIRCYKSWDYQAQRFIEWLKENNML